MASGWNLWGWLVSGVVRRYMYYRYPHNNYYFPTTPLVLTLFWQYISSLFHRSFLNVLVYVIFLQCYN